MLTHESQQGRCATLGAILAQPNVPILSAGGISQLTSSLRRIAAGAPTPTMAESSTFYVGNLPWADNEQLREAKTTTFSAYKLEETFLTFALN